MRMEVRCCCQPQKLLGTVEVRNGTVAEQAVYFGLMVDWSPYAIKDETVVPPTVRSLTLYTDIWTDDNGERHVAVKAEGVGLDVLRRIPSFEETT